MTSMRGGFKSAVKGVTGSGGKEGAPVSPTKKFFSNVLTVALVVFAAWMLARRFGWLK